MNKELALSMKNITKSFPGVLALDNVDLELMKGEVLCLLGENGAGKSTLIKILTGVYERDSGQIEVFGQKVNFKSPRESLADGISIIYQELNYIGELTVAENIFLERQPIKGLLNKVDWQKMYKMAEDVLSRIGIEINPRKKMKKLSVAEKQLVEIAKALSQDMKILITDEPTSALNDSEANKLFEVIQSLKGQGVSVIFISHKLEEVKEIGDRVLVLRDGVNAGLVEVEKTSKNELVTLMVGRELNEMYPTKKRKIGKPVLQVKELETEKLIDINFELHQGEILGFFGLLGSGIQKVGEAIFGRENSYNGQILINGKKKIINSPMDAIRSKVAFVPGERKYEGLVLSMDITENMSLPSLYDDKGSLFLDHYQDKKRASNWVEELNVKTPSIKTQVKSLSGGNQQKIVLGKWLDLNPDILILAEPTRGIDVGAKAEIYSLMERFCEKGVGIILISSELPEVIALSDHIVVMSDGQVCGKLNGDKATKDSIMNLAMGGNYNE